MLKIEWGENRPLGSHLQAYAQRNALGETDLLFLPELSTPLLKRIIQRARELK